MYNAISGNSEVQKAQTLNHHHPKIKIKYGAKQQFLIEKKQNIITITENL